MPVIRKLTPDELNYLAQQGVDIDKLPPEVEVNEPENKTSTLGAIGSILKSHAGGLIGGGGAALALAPFTEGLSLIPAAIATALGATAGGYGGQKLQNALQGEDVTKKLQEEQAQAEKEHPIAALGTDITAGALLSGGWPKISNIPKAARALLGSKALSEADQLALSQMGREGLSKAGNEILESNAANSGALRAVGVNAALNPAINTGINLGITGQLPSGTDLLAQSLGGAVFNGQSRLGRLGHPAEPSPEPTSKWEGVKTTDIPELTPNVPKESPFTQTVEGKPVIDDTVIRNAWKEANSRPDSEGMSDVERYKAQSDWKRLMKLPVQEQRNALHEMFIKKQSEAPSVQPTVNIPKPEPTSEVNASSKPEVEKLSVAESKPALPISPEKPAEAKTVLTPEQIEAQKQLDEEVNKPNEVYAPKDDIQRYVELEERQMELMKSGQYNTDEFHQLWKEKEGLKNKYGGMPPSEDNNKLFAQSYKGTGTKIIPYEGKTIGEALTMFKSDPKLKEDPHIQLLHNLNLDKDALKVPITFTDKDTFPVKRSYYDVNDDKIYMSPKNGADTFAHEVLHAALVKKFPATLDQSSSKGKEALEHYLKNGDNEHIKEIIRCYIDAANSLGIHDELFNVGKSKYSLYGQSDAAEQLLPHGYPMSTLHEFTASIMNDAQFRERLNSLPSSKPNETIWSRFVNAIRNLLGIDVKNGSMLERVLHATEHLAAQDRPIEDFSARREAFAPKDEISLPWTASVLSKIRKLPHPLAEKVADAATKTLNEREERIGITSNKILQTAKELKITEKDKENLQKISQWENLNHQSAPNSMFQNDKQRAMYKVERAVYSEHGDYRLATNEPVLRNGAPTKLIKDPTSHPTTPDPKVIEIYKKNEDTKKIASLDKEFIDNAILHGYSPANAQEALENWKKGVQGTMDRETGNLAFYNAQRRAQGVPLPESFARKDYLKNLEVYYNRAATDNTFYKHMESNPDVLSALRETKDAWGNPVPKDPQGGIAGHSAVRALIDEFRGEPASLSLHNEKGLSNLATTLFISWPGLQTHKLISNIVGLTTYADNPFQYARILTSALKDGVSGYQHAVENGIHKLTSRSWSDVLNGTATSAEKMQSLAHSMRKVSSLNDWTEKWNVGLMQAGCESVIANKIAKANGGDKSSINLLTRLDPSFTLGRTYTQKEQSILASHLVGQIHGTGDARTMPAWMLSDSEVSGFFKLAHWSIAQTNRFMSDVLTPAIKGNDYKPLLNSLFGAAIGGYLIKEVREKLAGKKGQIPSLAELNASDQSLGKKIPLYAYEFMAAAQYSGFGGLLSQVAKYPFDFVYKNHPQGATFPMDEVVTDLASTLGHVSTAIANDPNINWLHLAEAVSGHMLTQNVQLARMAYNQGIDAGLITGTPAEKKELADKLGQLRRFNMVEGLPYNEEEAGANPYVNIEQKRFKMEQNPEEAGKMIPQLIGKIMEAYSDKPDVMMAKIKALKQNSYATFPSLESTPLSFVKYLSFLGKTEGADKAQEALMDYYKHKVVNEAKASVVP